MNRLQISIRKAQNIAVHIGGGKVSSSPKVTGQAGHFSLGKTSGGHPISSYSHKEHNEKWNHKDHMDAYRAHFKHVTELSQISGVHKNLLSHHKEAMQHHWKSANSDVSKSFSVEWFFKSQGHRVIGKTSSGKKVYHHHGHHKHKHFSKQDHKDAAEIHHKKVMRVMDKMMSSKGKMQAALGKVLKHHGEGAYHHHHHGHK